MTARAGLLYLKNHYSLIHWLVLPFGLFLTMILALYLKALLSQQVKAEKMAKRMTSELAVNEQKYRGLFDQNKDGLVVCDLKGIIMDANKSVQDMTGYSLQEINGRSYSDFIPEKWKPFDNELIRNELMKKGYSDFYERECIRRDGSIFPVSCRAWVIRSPESGLVTGVTIWFRDISERKILERRERLNKQRTEGLIRIIQKQFPTIRELLDYTLDEAIKLTESRIGYIYNYDEMKQEFILNTWSSEVMRECTVKDRETLTRYELAHTGIWGEAVRQARPIIINDFDAPNPLKKGYPEGHVALKRFLTLPVINMERIVAVVGVANKDIDYDDDDVNQLTLLMGSVWQITERRRAEESIKEFEQRYYSIFEDNLAVMLVIHPETGRIIDANRAAVNYYGYGKTELTFMKITDINIMKPEEVAKAMQKAKTQMENAFIFRHRLKSGEVRDVEVFSGPIVMGRKTFLYSIVHDITERRKTEDALRASEE
ncbi:PAS domain S-box protein, partial [archaeon]|nr:PAS domain S-box protein [archaeon]